MKHRMKAGMGRGTLYLMIANGVFLVSGYIIHFGLGRYLGPELYGLFGVVLYLMTTVNLLLTSGFPQGASKYIAEDNTRLGSIVSYSFRIQALLSLLIFAIYFGLAGPMANLLNDPALIPYIRISAFVIPAYAIFSIYSGGYLNGLRQFGKQAKALICGSIAKIAGVIILVWVGLSVNGAILGYLFGALVGLLLAWKYLRPIERGNKDFEWAKLVKFGIPATLFAVTLLLLMSIDLFAVKAITIGDTDTGLYTSATTIARLPYFLFAGLALTLLPSISRSTSIGDFKLTCRYISQSIRYMLMLLIPAILIISATSADLVTLVYSSRYIEAAEALSVLVLGLGLIAVFNVLSNIIMGSGKPGVALGIALPLVPIDIALNLALIPQYGLLGAAIATTLTGLIGMVAAAAYVLWRFRTLVPPKSLLRICAVSAVIYAIALNISLSSFLLPLLYIGLFTIYFGLLFVMKEFKREDVETFKRIIPLEGFKRFSTIRQKYLKWAVELTHELFPMVVVVYLALLLVEAMFARSISSYLSLNYLLIAVIVVGVVAIVTAPREAQKLKEERLTRRDIFIIIGTGILGATTVWYKTQEIGWLCYVISVVSGALIVLLCILVRGGAEEGADERENSQ